MKLMGYLVMGWAIYALMFIGIAYVAFRMLALKKSYIFLAETPGLCLKLSVGYFILYVTLYTAVGAYSEIMLLWSIVNMALLLISPVIAKRMCEKKEA